MADSNESIDKGGEPKKPNPPLRPKPAAIEPADRLLTEVIQEYRQSASKRATLLEKLNALHTAELAEVQGRYHRILITAMSGAQTFEDFQRLDSSIGKYAGLQRESARSLRLEHDLNKRPPKKKE